ncbi:MAG: hypothetical protein IJR58_05300 [Lachnospiraceae bacterium]|nr:hypothetical protein [Lachnospiraceae bacterium]
MKKFVSIVLAGAMICAMVLPVTAASSASSGNNSGSSAPRVEASAPAPTGFPAAVVSAAAAVGKTAAEYVNNAIVSTPGLEGVPTRPVAQGGHITVNGARSRVTFILNKVPRSVATSANTTANAMGGTLLNVTRTSCSAMQYFNNAIVPFYMRGLDANSNVRVMRLTAAGWEEVVAASRTDHVDVLMTGHETLMFVLMPPAAQ